MPAVAMSTRVTDPTRDRSLSRAAPSRPLDERRAPRRSDLVTDTYWNGDGTGAHTNSSQQRTVERIVDGSVFVANALVLFVIIYATAFDNLMLV